MHGARFRLIILHREFFTEPVVASASIFKEESAAFGSLVKVIDLLTDSVLDSRISASFKSKSNLPKFVWKRPSTPIVAGTTTSIFPAPVFCF